MNRLLKKLALLLSVLLLFCAFTFACSAENFEVDANTGAIAVAEEAKLEIIHEGIIYLGKGKTSKVTAKVTGVELQPQIVWSSSDETVATVDENGILKGVGVGKTEIIATSEVGGKVLTAKYPVKVVEKEDPLKSYLEQHNVLSFQYDYDNNCYYANDKKSWQKDFGFARIYDYCAPYVGMEYDYIRVFFNYENRDFMLQLWKGLYVGMPGCEIGLYDREEDGLKRDMMTLYYAAEEEYWPIVDMSLYHQVEEGSDEYEFMFKRPTAKYWWCTGFVEGELRQMEPADELRMVATLTMKDEQMTNLVCGGLCSCGFKQVENKDALTEDTFCKNGRDVSVMWQNISEADNSENEGGSFIVALFTFLLKIFMSIGWFEAAFRLLF